MVDAFRLNKTLPYTAQELAMCNSFRDNPSGYAELITKTNDPERNLKHRRTWCPMAEDWTFNPLIAVGRAIFGSTNIDHYDFLTFQYLKVSFISRGTNVSDGWLAQNFTPHGAAAVVRDVSGQLRFPIWNGFQLHGDVGLRLKLADNAQQLNCVRLSDWQIIKLRILISHILTLGVRQRLPTESRRAENTTSR